VFGIAATLWTLLTGKPPSYGVGHDHVLDRPGASDSLKAALVGALELAPERRTASAEAFARAIGAPLHEQEGRSLALSVEGPSPVPRMLEAIVRAAAGMFDAAAASIALVKRTTAELVFQAAWGAGAAEITGVRLARGAGIAGAAIELGQAQVVADCTVDDRFASEIAAITGYLPSTMLVVPLSNEQGNVGALSLLDRRDGHPYGPEDIVRATLFCDLALAALEPAGTADAL
jgi:hypothetical protein